MKNAVCKMREYFLSVYLFVCLQRCEERREDFFFVCLFVCLSVYLFVCKDVRREEKISFLFVCLSVCLQRCEEIREDFEIISLNSKLNSFDGLPICKKGEKRFFTFSNFFLDYK
jgi:hypothetical protein